MPKKTLEIICGEETCYDKETSQMCQFVLVSHFGTRYHCGIFRDSNGDHITLNESNLKDLSKSMLSRCDQCLEKLK